MKGDGDSLSVVCDRDRRRRGIDRDRDRGHLGVSLSVIRGIDEDLIKDLVEGGNITTDFPLHLLCGRIKDPHLQLCHLDAPDVRLGAQKDVFDRCLLLIHLCQLFSSFFSSSFLSFFFAS